MMTPDEIIEELVGVPYLATGRDEHGVDCYGLVVLVLEMMDQPRPPRHLVEPTSLRAQIAAFRNGVGEWVACDRHDGAVALVGGDTPHHAGIALKNGILHAQRSCGVCFDKRNPIFAGSKFYRWEAPDG